VNGPVTIDINHDGIADFQFSYQTRSAYHIGFFRTVSIRPLACGGR
jgi:hypothetical protein